MSFILTRDLFDDSNRCIIVGNISNEMVGFIKGKCKKEELSCLRSTDITLWEDRLDYTDKHKANFAIPDEYNFYVEHIPYIIENPDYIGIYERDGNHSIQFMKCFNRIIVVGVRITLANGKLSYRTMYPINECQLSDYMRKNKAWEYNLCLEQGKIVDK